MKFNENLKYLRKEEKMTQENLAERLNVSRQAVTKWESGQSLPDIENLKQIADLFGVTMDSLVGDVENKKESNINKKINDIGYFIFGAIILLIGIFFSIYSFIEKITSSEDIKVISSIILGGILFISFVLMIKLYLKDTKSEIINMKPTEEGKKERRKRLKKKCIMEIKGMLMFGLINNIYFLPDGIGIYFLKILEWTLGSIILVAIIAIIENKKIEDKVKKLNQME